MPSLPCPVFLHGGRQCWGRVGMASPGCCRGCVTGAGGAQAPAPALCGALSASLMGWEAQHCSSGLHWYWDDAVAGLWASTSLPDRLLYWSEVGSHPRVMKAAMDGSRRHMLVAQGLGWPTALALDLPTWRIFWLDEKLGSVGSARLDGTGVKVCGGALVTGPQWGPGLGAHGLSARSCSWAGCGAPSRRLCSRGSSTGRRGRHGPCSRWTRPAARTGPCCSRDMGSPMASRYLPGGPQTLLRQLCRGSHPAESEPWGAVPTSQRSSGSSPGAHGSLLHSEHLCLTVLHPAGPCLSLPFPQVMHPSLRLTAPSPCTARGCSHLCLLSARHAGQCRCPARLTLADDETTCLPLRDSAFALLASPAAVAQVPSSGDVLGGCSPPHCPGSRVPIRALPPSSRST